MKNRISFFFFFSSRRLHTIWPRDWSSGVCSSDLLDRTRRRVDKYGVAEPAIYRQENDQIALQLPGVKNPQEAIAFIKTAGRLEFKLLNTTDDPQKALAGQIPPDSEVLYGED